MKSNIGANQVFGYLNDPFDQFEIQKSVQGRDLMEKRRKVME